MLTGACVPICSAAITSDKLGTGAVTVDKLHAGAVTTAAISDAVVVTSKLEDGAVTSAKLAGSAVNTNALADGAVTTAKTAFTDGLQVSGGDVVALAETDSPGVTSAGALQSRGGLGVAKGASIGGTLSVGGTATLAGAVAAAAVAVSGAASAQSLTVTGTSALGKCCVHALQLAVCKAQFFDCVLQATWLRLVMSQLPVRCPAAAMLPLSTAPSRRPVLAISPQLVREACAPRPT